MKPAVAGWYLARETEISYLLIGPPEILWLQLLLARIERVALHSMVCSGSHPLEITAVTSDYVQMGQIGMLPYPGISSIQTTCQTSCMLCNMLVCCADAIS